MKRVLRTIAIYAVISVVTIALLDVALIALDILPPNYPRGHAQLGWVTSIPTGKVEQVRCKENSTGEILRYQLNGDGIRSSFTAQRLRHDTSLFTIAATGDSQTDLCAPNEAVHFGAMETFLKEQGIPAAVFAYGAGRYSPLQAYLAVKQPIADYHADALVLKHLHRQRLLRHVPDR
jgi:hypothetical protein